MSAVAVTLLTYLWHYLVARFVYDQLVRPLIHGHVSVALVICGVCVGGFAIGKWRRRQTTRGASTATGRRRP